MNDAQKIRVIPLSTHVVQFAMPTPTLPPAFETNTYLISSAGQGVLVDAGAQDEAVLAALVEHVRHRGVTDVIAIAATHYHRDHTQGMPYLQQVFAAPIYVHALDKARALEEMKAASADVQDMPKQIRVGELSIDIQHAPGHTHGHVHILIPADEVMLVGDHLAGDGSVWIGPPDGHMSDYYAALDAIQNSGYRIAGPGHGTALHDAADAARRLKQRREARELQILAWLQNHPATLSEIVNHLYGDTVIPEAMWVAKKTVQAHLVHLLTHRRVKRSYHTSGKFMYESM